MKIIPKPAAIERYNGGQIGVTIDTEGGARYFVTLYPNGGGHVEVRVMRQGKPHTRVMRPSDQTKKLIRTAKQMASDQMDFAAMDLITGPSPLDKAPPLILPPSPPTPAPTYGYLSVQGARNLAEELLATARRVESTRALVGDDAHEFIRVIPGIALRVGA